MPKKTQDARCEDCKNWFDMATDALPIGYCVTIKKARHRKNPVCQHFCPGKINLREKGVVKDE